MNIILLIGATLGFLSVMIAAYIDHTLAFHLAEKTLHSLSTAVRYHQLYAIVIAVIGLTLPWQTNRRVQIWLTRSAILFLVGILLFSFSIYTSFIFNLTSIIYCVPAGGVVLMIGWLSLIRTSLLNLK